MSSCPAISGVPKGILLMNKPAGVTSFQSLGAVKSVYGTKKVGHTGTLDKFARGLMIVLVGKYTKLNPLFTGMDKTYEALIHFGEETDTLDPEGEVVAQGTVPTLSDIESVLPDFMGELEQIPPRYSAIHINGKRSWRLAREGVVVEMKSRSIRINHLEILNWSGQDLSLRVSCSSGTYIRSLARDLALACGSRAHLKELDRTVVGPFSLEEAHTVDREGTTPELLSLVRTADRLPFAGTKVLNEKEEVFVSQGVPPDKIFPLEVFAKGLTPLFDGEGELAALLEKDESRLKYRFVM
jgi:tRNA pseudouridine55 synthase